MKNTIQPDGGRSDILACLEQLGDRADELGFHDISGILGAIISAESAGMTDELSDCSWDFCMNEIPDFKENVTKHIVEDIHDDITEEDEDGR